MHILAYSVYTCKYKSRAAWREAQKGNQEKEQSVARKDGERKKDMNVVKEEDPGGNNIKSRKNRLAKKCSEIGRVEANCLSKGNKVHLLPLVCQTLHIPPLKFNFLEVERTGLFCTSSVLGLLFPASLEEFVVICFLYETQTELRQTLSIPLIYLYFPDDSGLRTLFHMVIGHFDFLFLESSLHFYQPTG